MNICVTCNKNEAMPLSVECAACRDRGIEDRRKRKNKVQTRRKTLPWGEYAIIAAMSGRLNG